MNNKLFNKNSKGNNIIIYKELIKEDVKQEIIELVEEDVKQEIIELVEEDVKQELVEEDVKQELVEEDIKQESVEEDVKQELVEEDIKQESVEKDLKQDIKQYTLNSIGENKEYIINKLNDTFINDSLKEFNTNFIEKNNDKVNIEIFNEDYYDEYVLFDNSNIEYKKENNIGIIINNLLLENEIKLNIESISENIEFNLLENKEFILDNGQLNNLLNINEKKYFVEISDKYNLSDLYKILNMSKEAIILIQIIDGNIKFIEKKGYESRNQSVIDLLIDSNNYKKLPDIQFIIFTNDIIDDNMKKYEYLLTFCKNITYNTNLFPNFNFNHWKEANIDYYSNIYDYFINNLINWNDKDDTIFWSGNDTNIIRKKIYDISKNIDKEIKLFINLLKYDNNNEISILDINKYKYLLNINGNSYAGRLNYLYLSGSCIIILKNNNINKCYNEFFYDKFILNEDYLEVLYDDDQSAIEIINNIYDVINNNNCEIIAKNCYNKAIEIFKKNNIYDYIYDLLLHLSKKNIITQYLSKSIFYTYESDIFYKDRLLIDNNEITFSFKGIDFEISLINEKNESIDIKIIDNKTIIYYNNLQMIEKYTPFLLLQNKNQLYKIIINKFNLILNIQEKFNIINMNLPIDNFIIINTLIKTKFGGWWII